MDYADSNEVQLILHTLCNRDMIKNSYAHRVLAMRFNSIFGSSDDSRKFQWHLIGALIITNILVFLVMGYSLLQVKNQYELRAIGLAQNVANAIDQNVSSRIDKIDFTLLDLKKEVEDQLASKNGLEGERLLSVMGNLEMRLPEVENYRLVNTDGAIILGRLIDPKKNYSVADRDYFNYHVNHDDGSLQISKPVMGRVIKKPLITLSRRLNFSDGQFAGIIYATITTDSFYKLLSGYDIGPQGSLVLRDMDLGLISRFPPRDDPAGIVGETTASPEVHQQIDSGHSSGTIFNSHGPDGIPRIVSYHRLAKIPMIVIAAVAPDDYLASYSNQVRLEGLIAFSFLVISVFFGFLILRSFNDSRRTQESLRQTLADLQNERRLNEAIVESSNDAIIGKDLSGNVTSWNVGAEKIFGYKADEIVGRSMQELIPPNHENEESFILSRVMSGERVDHLETIRLHKDGRLINISTSIAPVLDSVGKIIGASNISRDITARVAADEQLRKLSLTVDQSPESVVITNLDGNIEYVNEAFIRNTGYSRDEAMDQNPRILQSGKTTSATYKSLWETLLLGKVWKGELHNKRKNGSEYVEYVTINPIRNKLGVITHYVAIKADITANKAAEAHTIHLAFYDQLTDLPNRQLLLDRLQQALVLSARNQKYGALLFIDLDHFKSLNDTLGHDAGDKLLQQVAFRLLNCVRESDTVARIGGDEFVIMLEELSQDALESGTFAELIGKKILDAFQEKFEIGKNSCQSTPSIGIALFSGHRKDTIDDILKQADLAMYDAKAAGRNSLRFFDAKMQTAAILRARIESDLRVALDQNLFQLYYQPQFNKEGQIVGAEALLRMQHPERGLIAPGEFIAVAEETGLILPIGKWVLETACAQLAKWATNRKTARLTLGVNVSARQFRDHDFVDQVLSIMHKSGANSYLLKLEPTESVLLENMEETIERMSILRIGGVHFALDDFGTGYSSLAYLKKLPLDQLKIDQSFVREVPQDPHACSIVRAIITLAKSLELDIIAEGVETESQRQFLLDNGCELYQGYLFSRPISIGQFNELVQSDQTQKA